MISGFQALVLGLLQGITELFPISSLGHSIILPGLLGWHFAGDATDIVGFIIATHLATALVLLFIYRKDWILIAKGILRSFKMREVSMNDPHARLGWLLIVGTVPVGVMGVLFEKQAKEFFSSPRQAAFFLIVNGILLFGAELLRRRKTKPEIIDGADERIGKISWGKAIAIGSMQIFALLPGISRTGSAMTGGLLADLSHEDALRFSFLLSTPVIAAAALLELPGLFAIGGSIIIATIIGAIGAAAAAYGSIRFLTHHFKTKTLIPFAAYCVLAGALAIIFIR